MATVLEDAMLDAFEATEGIFTERGTYTPVGGPPVADVLAKMNRTDVHLQNQAGGTQRRGWVVHFPTAVLAALPTDGATFSAGGNTVIIRTAVYEDSRRLRIRCEAQDA